MSETTSARKPLHGSCHCGKTRYIVFLTLPHKPVPDGTPLPSGSQARDHQEIYRCNCTTCHKAGHFHMRLPWAPEDFLLFAPRDPLAELGDYRCHDGNIRWLFCRTCGVRCFLFQGEGESAEADLDALGVTGVDGSKLGKITVWRPKAEGWGEGRGWGCYLSVNGHTIDAGQQGFDLRQLTEDKVVLYVDCLTESGEPRFDKPHDGGSY